MTRVLFPHAVPKAQKSKPIILTLLYLTAHCDQRVCRAHDVAEFSTAAETPRWVHSGKKLTDNWANRFPATTFSESTEGRFGRPSRRSRSRSAGG
eukprot:8857204-Pyramimonas_sp.AAC.1